MTARDLTPERRNELMQWTSLGHSPTELARLYGVSITTVWRMRKMMKMGIRCTKSGRYPPVPAETVAAIISELRKDAKRGRRRQLAFRFGLDPSTVCRIALESGEFPKSACGRKSRHNKETLRRLKEYFADG